MNMKKSDLQPTYENLLKCFKEDSIGRNYELFNFVRLINSVEGAFSIALNGKWGSGKTFFVKQTKMLFESFNEHTQMSNDITEDDRESIKDLWSRFISRYFRDKFDPQSHVCVYFDAWEHDNDSDPLASIIYTISETATSAYNFEGERKYLDIASNIVTLASGRDYKPLLESLKSKRLTDTVKANLSVQEEVNEYLVNLLPEHGERLLVFIDELDRCNPQYAIQLLEKVKHYFSNDQITFVFSVNLEQLQYTIKQYYGNDFDSYRYLDRFFDLTIQMPKLNLNDYYTSSDIDTTHTVYQIANAVVKHYNLEMREISRYFATLRVATTKQLHRDSDRQDRIFCFCFVLPIALGLSKYDINMYERFINGDDSAPLVDILNRSEFLYGVERFIFNRQTEDPNNYDSADKAERLKEVYETIFSHKKDRSMGISVGGMRVDDSTTNYLLDCLGMLNITATFD